MSKTIEFGAFINGADGTRLAQAQATARSLGVQVTADGSPMTGTGGPGAPVKVTVTLPAGTALNTEAVQQGVDAFDALLRDNERLTDYALVKDNGVLTEVVSLLTAEVKSVAQPAPARFAAPAPAAPAARRRPRFGRRW